MSANQPVKKFLFDVMTEYEKAMNKFPTTENADTALTEEVGELMQALLHITEKAKVKGAIELQTNVYREAVQVAGMALKIAVHGIDRLGYKGMNCGYPGCENPCQKQPCALCYE